MNDGPRVSVRLATPRETAFEVFTAEIDAWWRRGQRFRHAEKSTIALQPRVGGRLTETEVTADGPRVWVLGQVLAWDPPKRVLLAWRASNFRLEDPSTEVEITFERAIGHSGEGTLVSIEHRGWSNIRPDHPVRHGMASRTFVVSLGRFWGDLMSSLHEHTTQ